MTLAPLPFFWAHRPRASSSAAQKNAASTAGVICRAQPALIAGVPEDPPLDQLLDQFEGLEAKHANVSHDWVQTGSVLNEMANHTRRRNKNSLCELKHPSCGLTLV